MRLTSGSEIIFPDYLFLEETEQIVVSLERINGVYQGSTVCDLDPSYMWNLRCISLYGYIDVPLLNPVYFMWGLTLSYWDGSAWQGLGLYGGHGVIPDMSPFLYYHCDIRTWVRPRLRMDVNYRGSDVDIVPLLVYLYFDGYRR